jgi:hypothetical protein
MICFQPNEMELIRSACLHAGCTFDALIFIFREARHHETFESLKTSGFWNPDLPSDIPPDTTKKLIGRGKQIILGNLVLALRRRAPRWKCKIYLEERTF